MNKEKVPIEVDFHTLQTELWFTGFGKNLKQLWNPNDKVIFEGELYKYKPGLNTMYITRWWQLTQNSFRIYKNQVAAKGFSFKPMIALPLSIFKGVKALRFNVPEKGKNLKLVKILNRNQFEIIYKDEILDQIMKNFLQSKIIERQDEGNVVELENDLDFEQKI